MWSTKFCASLRNGTHRTENSHAQELRDRPFSDRRKSVRVLGGVWVLRAIIVTKGMVFMVDNGYYSVSRKLFG